MNNDENTIKKQDQKNEINIKKPVVLDSSFHFFELKNEAKKCFKEGLYYGAIFCIHSAITSLLMFKINKKPKFKENIKKWRIPSMIALVKKANFVEESLKKRLIQFSLKRGELEHPKTLLSNLFTKWDIDPEETDTPTYVIEGLPSFNNGPKTLAEKGILAFSELEERIF